MTGLRQILRQVAGAARAKGECETRNTYPKCQAGAHDARNRDGRRRMGFRGSRVQIPPSRLFEDLALQATFAVGLFLPRALVL